jgi:hypothetical protein
VQQKLRLTVRIAAALCLLACVPGCVFAQAEGDLTAKKRLLSNIGPGLRAVRLGADGRTYVLASPSPGLVVFDTQGKQVLAIGASQVVAGKAAPAAITFGEDFDVDASGRIYVADRGSNSLEVFSPDGALLRSTRVNAPISVAALGEGEAAVATLNEPRLVIVYDKNGRNVREFGDPEQISDREDLNRFLNIGQLATDARGHVYYAFAYAPEPTVRQYDRNGYSSGQDIQYTALEAAPEAQAVRHEIERQEKRGKAPAFKRVLTAVGVDSANGDVWIATGNTLLRFDKDGTRRAGYQLYTPEGARLQPNTILVEPEHLIIGSDPLGIYDFDRPDKKIQP